MTDNCVVVIRMKDNEEVIAILNGKLDDRLKVEHPFYARVNPASGNVTMVPFCPLSDERFFEFDVTETRFVVTASDDISRKFLSMINALDATIVPDDEYDPEMDDPIYIPAQVIPGNDTKH